MAIDYVEGDFHAGWNVEGAVQGVSAVSCCVPLSSLSCCTMSESSAVFSRDPANPLNVGGVHDYCPPQWIDHFFAHEKCKVTGTDATIMFKEPVVKMKRKDLITTVSDHYGLIITLRVT